MTDFEKMEAVKQLLLRFSVAKENQESLYGLGAAPAYCRKGVDQTERAMSDITDAIGLLELSRGKTIVERRFIGCQSWKEITVDLGISRSTARRLYRAAMLKLYKRLFEDKPEGGDQHDHRHTET